MCYVPVILLDDPLLSYPHSYSNSIVSNNYEMISTEKKKVIHRQDTEHSQDTQQRNQQHQRLEHPKMQVFGLQKSSPGDAQLLMVAGAQLLPFQAVLESVQLSFQSAVDKGHCHIGVRSPLRAMGTVGLIENKMWASKK